MAYMLAGQTDLDDDDWGGAIGVPHSPWYSSSPYLQVDDKKIPVGETLRHYFTAGYNLFEPPDYKHQITNSPYEKVPEKVTYNFDKSGVPDFCGVGGCEPLLSKRVKEKLEELEPGAHDFFSVIVEHPDTGEQIEGHYLTYIWQRPDIIDHANSLMSGPNVESGLEWARSRGFRLMKFYKKDMPHNWEALRYLVNFMEPGNENHHLWRGTVGPNNLFEQFHGDTGRKIYRDRLSTNLFVSDIFAEWMLDQNITGTKPITIIENSVEWYRAEREKGVYS